MQSLMADLENQTNCSICGTRDFLPLKCSKCEDNKSRCATCAQEHADAHCHADSQASTLKSASAAAIQKTAADFVRDKEEKLAAEEAQWKSSLQKVDEKRARVDAVVARLGHKKSKKNSKAANLVRLLKMKKNAKGNAKVKPLNRVYVELHFENQCFNAFVEQSISVSKALDDLCKFCAIQNQNDNPNAKQLRLFTVNDELLPLQAIVRDEIESGNIIQLKFLENK